MQPRTMAQSAMVNAGEAMHAAAAPLTEPSADEYDPHDPYAYLIDPLLGPIGALMESRTAISFAFLEVAREAKNMIVEGNEYNGTFGVRLGAAQDLMTALDALTALVTKMRGS